MCIRDSPKLIMKRIITIAILLFSVVSFAQIKVIETVPVEKLGKVNNNYIQKIGDEYTCLLYTSDAADDQINV